jgi:hypothetical protein
MSDKAIALLATLILLAGLLAWGIVVHFCCGYRHRRLLRREQDARTLRTTR